MGKQRQNVSPEVYGLRPATDLLPGILFIVIEYSSNNYSQRRRCICVYCFRI